MRGLFRVERVLEGDSSEIAVDGVGAGDRRVRIEMSRAEAAEIRPGSVLVVQCWAAELPAKGSALVAEPEDLAVPDRPGVEPGGELFVDERDGSLGQGERADQEFRALLGLD